MPKDSADGARNLLKRKRDERTGEFPPTMSNGKFGEASEALKRPNFDPSDGVLVHAHEKLRYRGAACLSFSTPSSARQDIRPFPGRRNRGRSFPGRLGLRKGNLLRAEGGGKSSWGIPAQRMGGAIRPALTHRIPSELRS